MKNEASINIKVFNNNNLASLYPLDRSRKIKCTSRCNR